MISSTGGVARVWGELLGQYEYDEDKECFVQSSTEQSNRKYDPIYLYRDEDGWFVGSIPGGNTSFLLWNTNSTNGKLPTGSWVYNDGETWQYDHSMTVTPGPLPPLPAQFLVTASGAFLGKVSSLSYLGVFNKTERWWAGRPVYVNTEGRFLYHIDSWMIADKLGFYSLRGSKPHHSPADERSWTYLEGSWTNYETVEKPVSVIVREGEFLFNILLKSSVKIPSDSDFILQVLRLSLRVLRNTGKEHVLNIM